MSTGSVPLGRYVLDLDHPGGTVLTVAGRRSRGDPPAELIEALQRPRGLAGRLDHVADTASTVTDKAENAWALVRGVIEGRALDSELLARELQSASALLTRLERAGRFGDAIRLARPLCRLAAVTLRWAVLVESVRAVVHAATALADPRAEASGLHELGTLHQAAGDLEEARRLLEQARSIRQRIGDREGLAATEHNLRLLAGRPSPGPRKVSVVAGVAVVVVALAVGLAAGIGGGLSSERVPTSASTATAASPARGPASTPAVAPPPSVTPPPPSVTPPPAGKATIDPASLDFGSEQLKVTGGPQRVTLTNSGNGPLAVSGVTVGGANPGDFAATGCDQSELSPGASCTVDVTFTPTDAGSRTATLSFAPSLAQVSLSGTGTASQPPPLSTSTTTSATTPAIR